MTVTVRELVAGIQREMLGDLHPIRATELLQKATALLGNCLEEIRQAEVQYAQVLLGHLNSEKKANRAKILAETTEEYARLRQAKDTEKLVTHMIASLKYTIRTAQEEMRLAR